MDLVTPSLGLIVWSSLAFFLLIVLLRRYAWDPILSSLRTREKTIEDSLLSAQNAREEMKKLNLESERLLHETRLEREQILKEAKEMKASIVEEARISAKQEGARMIEKAREEITNQKLAALSEVKNHVTTLSLEISEKILRKKFDDPREQENMIADFLDKVKLN
jgi:F-type H+-transporting ATPase subunit b